jgi:hypothetical protein
MKELHLSTILFQIFENCEILYGSFELEANRETAKREFLDGMLDSMITAYLGSFTPEERKARQESVALISTGVIYARK